MLRVPATVTKIQTLADRTLKLDVHVVQELKPEDELEVFKLKMQSGHFVFAVSEEIKEEDIPTDPVETEQKTPSQRLRAVLYVYYQKLHDSSPTRYANTTFDQWYSVQMNKLTEQYKQKIDELN